MAQPQTLPVSIQEFTWSPLLDTRNIRLIQLQGSSNPDAPNHLTLLETPLTTAPKYNAISYAWQGQTPSVPLTIASFTLQVTRNCEAALKRFRPSSPSQHTLLWIDAICIDQSPGAIVERNQQVSMMGEIFGRAEQVCVWLGSRKLDKLEDEYEAVLKWFERLDSAVSGVIDIERVRKVRKLAEEVNLTALARIHEKIPWFRRLWMVQEATLAKAAVFFRDDLTFRYAPLLRAVDIGLARGAGKSVEQIYYTLFVNIRLFYEVSRSLPAVTKGKPVDLAGFLFYAQIFRTSNPGDKIFALYGLLHKSIPDLPRPDYGKPIKDVYREATVAIIRFSRDLKILEMLHGGRATPGLVSWVPDWACECFPSLPMVGGDQRGGFHATKSSKSAFSISDDGLRLTVKGKFIDSIAACAPFASCAVNEELGPAAKYHSWTQNLLPTDPYWRALLERYPYCSPSILRLWNIHVLQYFIRFAAESSVSSNSAKDRIELYETLCSHTSNYSAKRIASDLDTWDRWRDILMRHDLTWSNPTTAKSNKSIFSTVKSLFTPSLAPYTSGGETLSTWPAFMRKNWNEETMLLTPEFAIFEEISRDPSVAEIHAMMHNSLRYQTIFRTVEGRLGMVCQAVKEGDGVVLIATATTPFVVRGAAEGCVIVGPAFVRGVMEGEVWGRGAGEGVGDVVLL